MGVAEVVSETITVKVCLITVGVEIRVVEDACETVGVSLSEVDDLDV